jgi:hypothetical protein
MFFRAQNRSNQKTALTPSLLTENKRLTHLFLGESTLVAKPPACENRLQNHFDCAPETIGFFGGESFANASSKV